MARANISIPDDLLAEARAAGLNVSRLAAAALTGELDRRAKRAAFEAYVDELIQEQGPVPPEEERAAQEWAEQLVPPPESRSGAARSA